jgi:hypothetical protein
VGRPPHPMGSDLKEFVSALVRHWLSKFLFLLALSSTIATYVPSFRRNFTVPRWLPPVLFVAAFFMGSFDLFRKQNAEMRRLTSENMRLRGEAGKVVLVLTIHEGSEFLRHFVDGRAVGTYLHLNASVENKGDRGCVISKYYLRIRETQTDGEVRPHGFSGIQGPKFQWGINTARKNLALDGFIRIPPHNLAGPDILPFHVDGVPPEDCHALHCELELTDTNGERAILTFQLNEYG